MKNRYTPQHGVLAKTFGCDWREIQKIKKNVYKWRDNYYEVVGYNSQTAPASHYINVDHSNLKWSFRELGEKSKLMKEINEQS